MRNKVLSEALLRDLTRFYKEYLWRYAPGSYELLDSMIKKEAKVGFVELMLEDPDTLKKVLLRKYGDEYTLRFLVENIVVKPLLVRVSRTELTGYVAELFLSDAELFKKTILELIDSGSS